MAHIVAITGATGNVGSALTEQLLKKGTRVRAIARSVEKLAILAAKGAEICAGDMQDTRFLADTFDGAKAVFAMIPTHVHALDFAADLQDTATSLAEALKRAGTTHAVALSAVGAELPAGTGPMVGLHTMEMRLQAISHLSIVALRPSYLMENHLAAIPLIKQAGFFGGVVRGSLPHPMIAARDIAAVAAEYLREPTFSGYEVRELLGPRDYTHRQATAILGTALGRPDLAYVEFSYEEFHMGLLQAGFSLSAADSYVEMFRAFNTGKIQPTSTRSRTNTTTTTLEQFAHEVFVPAYQALNIMQAERG